MRLYRPGPGKKRSESSGKTFSAPFLLLTVVRTSACEACEAGVRHSDPHARARRVVRGVRVDDAALRSTGAASGLSRRGRSGARELRSRTVTLTTMDLIRKALRDVEAAVKPRVSLTKKSDPNDLTGTEVVVQSQRFRVGAMFAEGGAARLYRCARVLDGPEIGNGKNDDPDLAAAPLALKQCLLPPELSDAETRHEGFVHASVSEHEDIVTLHAHDVCVPSRRGDAPGLDGPRAALLVMDLCRESLAERVRRMGGLGEAEALEACAATARAVAYLHARDPPIVHMDVKPENVLLSLESKRAESNDVERLRWRLCDFGSSISGERAFTTSLDRSRAESEFLKKTTPTYRAPEMWDVHRFKEHGVGKPADAWCLGCLLFETLENAPPFGFDSKLLALQGKFQFSDSKAHSKVDAEAHSKADSKASGLGRAPIRRETQALVRAVLAVDPSRRLSAATFAEKCEEIAKAIRAGEPEDVTAPGVEANDIDPETSHDPRAIALAGVETAPITESVETGWAAFDDEAEAEAGAADEKSSEKSLEKSSEKQNRNPADAAAFPEFPACDERKDSGTDEASGNEREWATF